MDERQERDIVSGLRSGNPDAWRTLYDAYVQRIWIGVARAVGPSDVGDVVQEVMIAAAKAARNFDESKGSLWPWLWGIARTQISLHFRKVQRHDRWKQIARTESIKDALNLESAELAHAVRSALIELPGDYDALLTAKYLDGESVETIANRERSNCSAIRSKLARARDAFRQAYLRLTGVEQETEATR